VGENPVDVSAEGCRDMGGNVWEWVWDWYDRYYYESLPDGIVFNPQGPSDGAEPEQRFQEAGAAAGNERSTRKVIKSAGWGPEQFARDNMRAARRIWGNPAYWLDDTGFRCAVSLSELK
jgi:formylglycine-generating enzyme required for sulfatase activity